MPESVKTAGYHTIRFVLPEQSDGLPGAPQHARASLLAAVDDVTHVKQA